MKENIFKKINKFFKKIFKKIKDFFALVFHKDKKTDAVKTKKFKSILIKDKDTSNKDKVKRGLWSFKMSIMVVCTMLLFIVSSTIIIIAAKKSIFETNESVKEYTDLDGTRYIAIQNGYIKDELVVETNTELPSIKDYFDKDFVLDDDATINYFENNEEVKIDDFTYEKDGKKYVKGIRTLDVVINNGSELTTKLAIEDSLPPVVETQDISITEGDTLNPESFVKSYKDNSQLETYYANIISLENYATVGEHNLSLAISDLSGNITVVEVKLTVVAKPQETTPSSGSSGSSSSSGGSSSSKKSSGSSGSTKKSSGGSSGNSGGSSGGSSGGNSGDNSGGSSGGSSGGGSTTTLTCKSGSVTKYSLVNNYESYNSGTPEGNFETKKKYGELWQTETRFGSVLKTTADFKVNVYENGATQVDVDNVSGFEYSLDNSNYKATSEDLLPLAVETLSNSAVKENINYILSESNKLRAAKGLSSLTLDNTLSKVAMIRSMEMAFSGIYSHSRPNGSCYGGTLFTTIYQAVASSPRKSYAASENITYGNSAGVAMESWKNSSAHLQAIVSSQYKYIGIGYYKFGSRTYWTQIFMS